MKYGLENGISDAIMQYNFWTYCPNLEYSKRNRIVQLLQGKIARGLVDTEDIVLRVRGIGQGIIETKVFRMIWGQNGKSFKIITKRRKGNNNR